jgi:putative hemolysin
VEVILTQDLSWRDRVLEFRSKIFSEVYGITPEQDRDAWDDVCWHVIAVDADRIYGCYRAIQDTELGFYSETEFDFGNLNIPRNQILEVGRAAVAPDAKSMMVITKLWSALMELADQQGCRFILGPSSIGLSQGTDRLSSLRHHWREEFGYLNRSHVIPKNPLLLDAIGFDDFRIPNLIKVYLKMGAEIAGDPSVDPVFGTADFMTVLDVDRVNQRWLDRLVQ